MNKLSSSFKENQTDPRARSHTQQCVSVHVCIHSENGFGDSKWLPILLKQNGCQLFMASSHFSAMIILAFWRNFILPEWRNTKHQRIKNIAES